MTANYSLELCLFDFVPNLAFLVGACFLVRMAELARGRRSAGLMTGGTLLIFLGGMFKAIWKLLYTIGAGDAFGGGFCSWWTSTGATRDHLADLDVLEAAVRAANMVAGIVCTRRGADPPWRHELPDAWGAPDRP